MNKKNALSYALMMVFSSITNAARDNHQMPYFSNTTEKMHELFNQMQQDFDKMVENMWSDVQVIQPNKQSTMSVTMPKITETDSHVMVSIKASSIDPDTIDIKKMPNTKGDYVVISIPEKTMTTEMTITPYEISYATKQEIKEEKTNDEQSKPSVVYYNSSSSMMRQSLPAKVMFEDIKAEYENEMLTITLQKREPIKAGQRITVIKK
jgi:HSP20 family molecular chaperone IbpA